MITHPFQTSLVSETLLRLSIQKIFHKFLHYIIYKDIIDFIYFYNLMGFFCEFRTFAVETVRLERENIKQRAETNVGYRYFFQYSK